MPPRLTHVAFQSADIDRTNDFYQRYCGLHVVHARNDHGIRVVWLSEEEEDPSFVLVVIGVPSGRVPATSFGEHLGFDVESDEAVDAMAKRAEADGILMQGPTHAGPIVGYFCIVRDPDGNLVEFSHGQAINPKHLPVPHGEVEKS